MDKQIISLCHSKPRRGFTCHKLKAKLCRGHSVPRHPDPLSSLTAPPLDQLSHTIYLGMVHAGWVGPHRLPGHGPCRVGGSTPGILTGAAALSPDLDQPSPVACVTQSTPSFKHSLRHLP